MGTTREEEEEVVAPRHLEHAFCGRVAGGRSSSTGAVGAAAAKPRSRQLMPRLTLRMRAAVITAVAFAELSANVTATPDGVATG
jgi:hypothetical protein